MENQYKVGRKVGFVFKKIYGTNGGMAGKGESPYNIKQEGKSGLFLDAHLNRSTGGLFDKHN